jgi:SP family general alpha glucoside:H+ symporter-like MFS transporter
MGQFIASGTMLGVLTLPGEWPYRLPFSLQLIWPLILIPLYYFCPESPWWYVRKGRLEDAAKSVMRLSATSLHVDASAAVAAMVRTNTLEVEQAKGNQPRWIDCFRGTDLRRTEISALAWASQVIAGGSYVIGFSTFFFLQAGLNQRNSFSLGLGVSACAFVGTILSWTMIHRFGRRQIYVVGLSVLCAIHFVIAGLSFPSKEGNGAARWAMCGLIMVWVMIYDFTVGPLAYAIVGETSSTRLRAKTVALSRNAYYIVVVINSE